MGSIFVPPFSHLNPRQVRIVNRWFYDVKLTRLLLGFGLRHFSMHPANLLTVKLRVLMSNMAEIEPLAAKLLKAEDVEKQAGYLEKLNIS